MKNKKQPQRIKGARHFAGVHIVAASKNIAILDPRPDATVANVRLMAAALEFLAEFLAARKATLTLTALEAPEYWHVLVWRGEREDLETAILLLQKLRGPEPRPEKEKQA